MSVELTIETVTETIVLELQDHVPAVLTIDHIPELRDELDSKVDKEAGLGLSELSFTTDDKTSLDQSEQDRHTHSNKSVIDHLSDDAGVLQYKGLPISDQAALDAKVDKVAGKSLVDDTEIAKLLTVAHDATKNATDAELRNRATHTGEQAISTVTGLQGALDSKVDKQAGKSLVDDAEIAKLATVQENATANRADSENADKVHEHVIADIDDLSAKLELINQWLQVPADKKYFDFIGNRYSADGVPATVSSLSTFTRLSTATMWKADKVIDVPENTPRINTDGLLIEPQRTNLFPNSVITTGVGVIPTTLEIGEGNIVPAVRLPQGIATYAYVGTASPSPCVISMYVKNSDNSEPAFSGAFNNVGFDFALVFAGSVAPAPYTVSKISTVYRVSKTVTPGGVYSNTGILKYGANSPKDVTATWRQLEAGDTLTSYIRSSGSPTTRAKETLVIPFTTGQTVTADKDEGVTMTIVDNNAVFEGQGYIRSIRVN